MATNFRFTSTYTDGDGIADPTVYFAYFDFSKGVYFIVPYTLEASIHNGTELTINEVADKIKNKEWVKL